MRDKQRSVLSGDGDAGRRVSVKAVPVPRAVAVAFRWGGRVLPHPVQREPGIWIRRGDAAVGRTMKRWLRPAGGCIQTEAQGQNVRTRRKMLQNSLQRDELNFAPVSQITVVAPGSVKLCIQSRLGFFIECWLRLYATVNVSFI